MKISRAKLRGKALDRDCKRANRTSHEFGEKDDRVFCWGLFKSASDFEIQDKCKECKAYVDNATPIETENTD